MPAEQVWAVRLGAPDLPQVIGGQLGDILEGLPVAADAGRGQAVERLGRADRAGEREQVLRCADRTRHAEERPYRREPEDTAGRHGFRRLAGLREPGEVPGHRGDRGDLEKQRVRDAKTQPVGQFRLKCRHRKRVQHEGVQRAVRVHDRQPGLDRDVLHQPGFDLRGGDGFRGLDSRSVHDRLRGHRAVRGRKVPPDQFLGVRDVAFHQFERGQTAGVESAADALQPFDPVEDSRAEVLAPEVRHERPLPVEVNLVELPAEPREILGKAAGFTIGVGSVDVALGIPVVERHAVPVGRTRLAVLPHEVERRAGQARRGRERGAVVHRAHPARDVLFLFREVQGIFELSHGDGEDELIGFDPLAVRVDHHAVRGALDRGDFGAAPDVREFGGDALPESEKAAADGEAARVAEQRRFVREQPGHFDVLDEVERGQVAFQESVACCRVADAERRRKGVEVVLGQPFGDRSG